MGTQLIFTVGTNPLPIWVAWYHLKNILAEPINVRLVHTQGTQDETNRLRKYCHGSNFLNPIQTSPGAPGEVRRDVEVVLQGLNGNTNLHVHYTGGTKVMSVETVAGLEYGLSEDINLSTSYLDPRGNSGPTIVDSYGDTLVPDTRVGIPADLGHVALLNGFTLAPFTHRYWDKNHGGYVTEQCPAPARLDNDQEAAGRDVLGRMSDGVRRGIPWIDFEYATYVALKEALERIATSNATRSNYTPCANCFCVI